MKKNLFLALTGLSIMAFSITSCTKDDNGNGGGGSDTSVFSKKIIVEDLTGAWCGYCPRVAYKLETYKEAHPNNIIVIGVHGGSSGADPYKYSSYTSYLSTYGVSGYPSAILERKAEWSESTSELDAALIQPALVGMKITSTVSTDLITGNVKVKFGTNMTNRSLKLVVALVENGLVYPQTNYYSPQYGATPYLYGGVSPISDFTHNGVLRKTATNLWGDAIPAEQQTKNNEYSFDFVLPTTGTVYGGATYTVDKTKAGIVAIVVDDTDPADSKSLNAQYADAGTTKNYD